MGTHRSRHNKGRKPFYKEHRDRTDWKRDPCRPAGRRIDRLGGPESNRIWETYLGHVATMSAAEAARLPDMPSRIAFIKKRNRDPEFAERAASAMAGRNLISRKLAPNAWSNFVARLPTMTITRLCEVEGMPSMAAVYKRRAADPAFRRQIEEARLLGQPIAYPYIIKSRDEHSDLMLVNSIVPKAFPDQMRADICQEIILAMLEGRVTVDDLKAKRQSSAWFLRKFYRDNFEQSGRALPFEMESDDGSFYETASWSAAKEWRFGEMNDRRRNHDALRTFQEPTQIEDTFHGQVRRKWIAMQEGALVSGDMRDMLSLEEVAALMQEGEAA